MCGNEVSKAKALPDLSLARNTKNNKQGYVRYVSQKRKAKKM